MSVVVNARNEAEDSPCHMASLAANQQDVLDRLIHGGHDPSEALEWVMEYVEPEEEEKPRFSIHDRRSADWLLKKLAECDADEAEVSAMLEARIEELRAGAERILAPIRRKREFFEAAYGAQLRDWAAEKLEGQKERSIRLLHGVVGFRKTPPKVIVEDEPALIETCERLGLPGIRVKKEVDKLALRRVLEGGDGVLADPEMPERALARLEGCYETFYVKAELPASVPSEGTDDL